METVDDEILLELATNVFELMLKIPVEEGPACKSTGEPTDYVSAIRMSGSSNMRVQLRAPEQTARNIAAMMFKKDVGALSEEDICDALGEVINMVGGNLKGLGDGESQLTLPRVSQLSIGDDQNSAPQVTVLVGGEPLHFSWQQGPS